MKLLREDQAQAKGQGHIFRYSPERAVIAASLVAAGCLVLTFVLARRSVGLAAVVVTSLTLFMFVMRRYVLARSRPTNWLVALNDEGVFVNTRSYLNYHFPPEDRTVVFIPFGEIRSARSIQEWRELPDPDSRQRNNTTVQRRRFVELEITGDSTELERALTDELVRRPPTERHWYGTSGTKYQHFPVTLESRTRLRIEWGAVPA